MKLVLGLILCGCLLFSQVIKTESFQIEYGPELPKDDIEIVDFLGAVNGQIYTTALKGKKDFYIKIINENDLSYSSSSQIKMPKYLGVQLDFEHAVLVDDQVWVLGGMVHRKKKLYHLVAYPIFNDGKINANQGVEIFNTPVEKKSRSGAFYITPNRAGDLLLVLHASPFVKEDAIKYEVKLFNKEMNYLMSHEEKVSFDDKKRKLNFDIADFGITENDDIGLLINENFYEKKSKTTVQNFYIDVFKAENNYEKERVKVNFEGKKIINAKTVPDLDGNFKIAGYYSDLNKRGKSEGVLDGIYVFNYLPKGNQTTEPVFNPFPTQTKAEIIGERRAAKGKDLKLNYSLSGFGVKGDGSLYIMGEFFTIIDGGGGGIGPLALSSLDITKNEIIVSKLNSSGKMQWSKVLPKKQIVSITQLSIFFFGGFNNVNNGFSVGGGLEIPIVFKNRGPEYIGYLPMFNNNGDLVVLFNDNEKNNGVTSMDKVKRMGNYNKTKTSAFILNNNGNLRRVDSKRGDKDQVVLRTGVYYEYEPGKYWVFSSLRRSNRVGKLQLLE